MVLGYNTYIYMEQCSPETICLLFHSVHIILYHEVVVEVATVDVEHSAFTSTTSTMLNSKNKLD